MKEMQALLVAAERLAAAGEEGVLVTLVKTEGSTYRRAGARMLVMPGCRTVGTISGGCLEGMVAKEAWAKTRGGGGAFPRKRVVITADSGAEDDGWGPASGCHGKLFLLAEAIGRGERHEALAIVERIRQGEEAGVIVHEFSVRDGELEPGGMRVEAAGEGTSRWAEGKGVAAFWEVVRPLPHVVICGAGEDARPVARIAGELGWRVDVVDSRARLATRERFEGAERVSAAGPAGLAGLLRRHSAAVVMSHRFGDDAEYVMELLGRGLAYVGLLGPRRRAERLLMEVMERRRGRGEEKDKDKEGELERVFSPVGLDIGAEGAEVIALAVVAEIQAVISGRDGVSLAKKVGAIEVEGIGARG